MRGHMTSVRDVAYSPSGRHIASAALDGEVKLWSADNGSQVNMPWLSFINKLNVKLFLGLGCLIFDVAIK